MKYNIVLWFMNTAVTNMNYFDASLQTVPFYPCVAQGCGKSYTKAFELVAHTRWHNQQGKYFCNSPSCEMRFVDEETLRRHKRTHTHKTFVCDICKKTFKQQRTLNKHKQTQCGVVSFTNNTNYELIHQVHWCGPQDISTASEITP
jgi:uncharacterized Zn-finger protein